MLGGGEMIGPIKQCNLSDQLAPGLFAWGLMITVDGGGQQCLCVGRLEHCHPFKDRILGGEMIKNTHPQKKTRPCC